MQPRLIILAIGIVCATGARAQDAPDPVRLQSKVVPNPVFQAQSEFAFPTADADTAEDRFSLGFTVSPGGSISNVDLTAFSGNSRTGYCDPICWDEGDPPTTYCVTMAGCPETGGGGGGTLSISPLILTFTPKTGDAGELLFDFGVEEISPAHPTFTGELSVTLPDLMTPPD